MNPSNPEAATAVSSSEPRFGELLTRVLNADYDTDADFEALIELTHLLPARDGEPVESPWHLASINLLIDLLSYHWRGRQDYFVGGRMFLYYRIDDLNNPHFKGPDFFL